MSVKKAILERALKLMSDPRVGKFMSNPKVMGAAMKVFELRATAQRSVDEQLAKVARLFHLATEDEIRELRATVRMLEEQLKQDRER